jgi:hypothetical protein
MATDTGCVGGRPQGDPAPSAREELPFQADAEGGLGYYKARKGEVRVLGSNDNALMVAENWKHRCAIRRVRGVSTHMLHP